MKKPVKSITHKTAKRAHIPSAEEAGYEAASARVQETPTPRTFPKNPIVHRGQDPELFWMHKYGADDAGAPLSVDLRSLYRHEHIAPEQIIRGLYRVVANESKEQPDLGFSLPELFGNATSHDELDKVSDYYKWSDGWMNRLMQGDSLLGMTSLLEREGMAGQVQCFYFDPPYGIKYGSNWQIKIDDTVMKQSDPDEALTGQPEQIKAFRDTWELGIHSYLSYLRDRLIIARDLLHDTGSIFVQISDENVHLVR
jgi:adenine-specific DNA-methyltransferase